VGSDWPHNKGSYNWDAGISSRLSAAVMLRCRFWPSRLGAAVMLRRRFWPSRLGAAMMLRRGFRPSRLGAAVMLRRGFWPSRLGVAVMLRRGFRPSHLGAAVMLRHGFWPSRLGAAVMAMISPASGVRTLLFDDLSLVIFRQPTPSSHESQSIATSWYEYENSENVLQRCGTNLLQWVWLDKLSDKLIQLAHLTIWMPCRWVELQSIEQKKEEIPPLHMDKSG